MSGDPLAAIVADLFGVTEDDIETLPDTSALQQARAEKARWRDVELPARIAEVESAISALLPDGLRIEWER